MLEDEKLLSLVRTGSTSNWVHNDNSNCEQISSLKNGEKVYMLDVQ